MASRPRRSATSPVVHAPPKGSSTVPPRGHPALMQGSTSAGGKVAKWASLKPSVTTFQTLRLLRFSTSRQTASLKLALFLTPEPTAARFRPVSGLATRSRGPSKDDPFQLDRPTAFIRPFVLPPAC